jgi:glucokinase
MKDSVVLGVDIGGSHLTAALVNEHTKMFIAGSNTRIRVNSSGSANEILNTWSTVINDIFKKYSVTERRIGIAMPGPFDYEKGISLIKNLNKYESLYKLNVKELLASQLHMASSNIMLMNDAACFLRGEVYHGAARGYLNAIGITLGTGTGTAFHHHGITGDANLGPSPFLDGIADEYFSTRWFVRQYAKRSGNTVKDVKELSGLYASENVVKEIFSEFVKNLAIFLDEFIKKEKPEVIVVGGNIAQCADLFLVNLEQKLRSIGVAIPIIKSTLGEDAAILGAASLFENKNVKP